MGQSSANAEVRPKNSDECSAWQHYDGVNCGYAFAAFCADVNLKSLYLLLVTS